MGCLYSMYSVEDRKILSILKRYEQPKKSRFLKIKEALGYRNDNILTADGDRKLTMQKLICLNDILNDGFYTKVIVTVFIKQLGIEMKTSKFLKILIYRIVLNFLI